MSTNLTNTFGVYENFKKRPDSLQQGRYQGLQQVTPTTPSKAEGLMRSLGSVSNTINQRITAMENQRKEEGTFKAEKILKSSNQQDKIELDTRALLQKANAIDLADNIYAMELIEGDVGRMHQAEFHRQFTEKMIKNGWEKDRNIQMQKYEEERQLYRKQLDDNRTYLNKQAFNSGFNEDYAKNSEDVFNLYTKWYSEESRKEALGALQQNIDECDFYGSTQDGTYSDKVSMIVNKARISGINENEIQEALAKKLEKVLENSQDEATIQNILNTNVGVWNTGEKQGQAKTFKDGLTVGALQEIEKTRQHNKWIADDSTRLYWQDQFIKATKQGREAVVALSESLKNDPSKRYIYDQIHPNLDKYVAQADAETEKREKERHKKLRADATNSYVASQGNRLLSGYLQSIISNGVTMPDGSALPSSLGDLKVPVMDENGNVKQVSLTKDDVLTFYKANIDGLNTEQKLMFLSSPIGRAINEDVKRACRNSYDQIRLDTIDNKDNADRIIANLSDFTTTLQSNPGMFREVYGDDLTDRMLAFNYLSNSHGQEAALRMIAESKSIDSNSDETKVYLTKINENISNDMNIRLNALDGEEADLSLDLAMHNDVVAILKARAKVFLANGMNPEEAVEQARNALKDDFAVIRYDGGQNMLLPKHLIQGTGINGYDLSRAFTNMVDSYRGDTPRRDVRVNWDFNTNTLTVNLIGSSEPPLYLTRQQLLSNEIPFNLGLLTGQSRQDVLNSRSFMDTGMFTPSENPDMGEVSPNSYNPNPEEKEGTDLVDWFKSIW